MVEGNFIGTNGTGSAALPNTGSGIFAGGGSGNTIGGTIAAAANVISVNGGGGIEISDDQDLIVGNMVGTNAEGIQPLGNTGDGIDVSGDQNTISGTVGGAGNIIAANSGSGGVLDGASDNMIAGNSIGVDSTGNGAMGNGSGVEIDDGGTGNTIGGTTDTARNFIAASASDDGYGILISGDSTTGNLVQGNYIGTGDDGISQIGNQADGVDIVDSPANTIGGTSAGAGNLFADNGGDGVDLDGATNTLVAGNLIGTNGEGNGALGNAKVGVVIEDASTGNTIGGTTPGALNVISGNSGDGVDIEGSGTSQNLVAGNDIGTDITGLQPLSNQGNGVSLADQASENTIGGNAHEALNVISANSLVGVVISGDGTDENLVAGNLIGTDVQGSFPLGNSSGVNIIDGASDNTIGGDTAGAGNVISGNSGDGVDIEGSGTSQNLVAGNDIGTNVGGTADLGNASVGIWIQNGSSGNTIGGTTSGAGNTIALAHPAFRGVIPKCMSGGV